MGITYIMVARTPASKKAKGRVLELSVAGLYRHYGLFPEAKRQLLSGGGYLKGDIYKSTHDWAVDECKNAETIKLNEWWLQANNQCSVGQEPVLHISSNRRPIATVWLKSTAQKYFNQSSIHWIKKKLNKGRFNFWKEYDDLWAEAKGENIEHFGLIVKDKIITPIDTYMILRTYETEEDELE